MKITIGSDHRGYEVKESIKSHFHGIEWLDVGVEGADVKADYPIITKKVCESIVSGKTEFGILICGSGVGVSIAANRYPKIYAALSWSPEVARAAREHDFANILAIPADFVTIDKSFAIVKSWLASDFLGGRYEDRLRMIDDLSK